MKQRSPQFLAFLERWKVVYPVEAAELERREAEMKRIELARLAEFKKWRRERKRQAAAGQ